MIELGAFLLPAVPLLVLVAFLLLGRYPGADAIVRLLERIAAVRRSTLSASPVRPTRPPTRAASGGQLLACALSGRAPPASLST